MLIAYLHQYYKTPEMPGGSRSYEMSRRFAAAGHDVHVITTREPVDGDDRGWRMEQVGAVTVHSLAVEYSNAMAFRRRLWAFMHFALLSGGRAGKLRPDVILATSTPLTITIPAFVARLRSRAPIVFEVRDLWPAMPIAIGALNNPAARWLARRLEHFAYHTAKSVIALSPGMADGVAATGIVRRDDVHVIPNSCDNDTFDVPDAVGVARRQHLDWAGDRPILLYSGTFGRINGVGWLARLAGVLHERGSDIQVLAVGDGMERPQIIEEAASLGVLGVNFHLMEAVPKQEIPALMSAATIALSLCLPMPELESNSANKFFDTLAAGRPAAINYGGWQADILQSTGAGIVMPWHDVEASANSLIEFVASPDRIASARAAARRLADEEYDRDKLAAQMLGVVESAAAKR